MITKSLCYPLLFLPIITFAESYEVSNAVELQRLLETAQRGDTIKLKAGNYTYVKSLQLVEKEGLTLEGIGDVWIIIEDIKDDVITIRDSKRISLKKIKARHQTRLPHYDCEGAVVHIIDSQEIHLKQCELNGSGAIGVYLENSKDVIIDQCYIHHNTLTAIMLDSNESVVIHNSKLTDNGSTLHGLNAGDIRMEGNTIQKNQGEITWSTPFTREILGN
jgi:nitrous oxidase accessory protein NosD